MKPPTLDDAASRNLLAEKGIHTFSNGTAWDCWASANCFECRHYDFEQAGACAFEAAAMLGAVSPALALLFGWTRHPEFADSWNEPETCPFFRQRRDDGDDSPEPPEDSPDPSQLVLLADPTEDAAILTTASVPVEVPA